MKLLSIATISFFSFLTWANAAADPAQFTGNWAGTGVYKKSGVHTYCPTFEMKFDGNRYLMNFLGGRRNCETHDEQFAPVAMAFQGGQLYYNGQIVGSIKGNVLESYFSMPEGNGRIRHWRMSMRREGQTIIYEESRTMNQETTPLISFTGLLTEQN